MKCILKIDIGGWPNIVCLWMCVRVTIESDRWSWWSVHTRIDLYNELVMCMCVFPMCLPHTLSYRRWFHIRSSVDSVFFFWFSKKKRKTWRVRNETKRNGTERKRSSKKKINKLNSLKKYLFIFFRKKNRFGVVEAVRLVERYREQENERNKTKITTKSNWNVFNFWWCGAFLIGFMCFFSVS